MKNIIDKRLEKNKLKIMTHVVAGYPNLETTRELIILMEKSGVDMIEIQIPFSDPLADGPTIMKANQYAIDNGITPEICLNFVKKIRKEVNIPLLFMTYSNIPFKFGMEKFIEKSSEVGINGLIIPDIPFDEDCEKYYELAEKYSIHNIFVVSPNMEDKRLKQIMNMASGFVYTTLKTGITGAGNKISQKGIDFLLKVRENSKIPIAAGFGISSKSHLEILKNKIDMAVIGSHVINLFEKGGIDMVKQFLTFQ